MTAHKEGIMCQIRTIQQTADEIEKSGEIKQASRPHLADYDAGWWDEIICYRLGEIAWRDGDVAAIAKRLPSNQFEVQERGEEIY